MEKIKGFTLVELIIVIAVLAVIVGMLIVAVDPQKVIENTRDSRARAEMNQVKTALQLYFNDQNSYPSNINDLVSGGYAKALPSVVSADWSWSYSQSGANYDAGITLNNATPDDDTTVSKCNSDGAPNASGNYRICPD